MTFLRGILFLVTTMFQLALILVGYWALSLGLYYYVSPFQPGYYEDAALSDVQAIALCFLLWDRFFGPYSKLLRDTAKILYAAKTNQKED